MSTACTWKHETTDDILQARAGIDLFDDELPGMISVYIRYADGSRAAARDILASHPSADKCLAAWCNGQHVRDYRAAAQAAYIARFETLAQNITYWCSRDKDDTRENRNLRRLWEIADNQPIASTSDALFAILRSVFNRRPA